MTQPIPTLGALALACLCVAAPSGDASAAGSLMTKGPSSVRTQGPAGEIRGRNYALLIGLERYRGLEELRFANEDVLALKEALTEPGVGRFDASAVTVITDADGQKVSGADLTTQLRTFVDRARDAELVLFFFSGHGMASNGEAYLLPTDWDPTLPPEDLGRYALSYSEVTSKLKQTNARQQLAMLDACRNSPPKVGKAGYSLEPLGEFMQALKQAGSVGSGFMLLTATADKQAAYEDDECGHGLFACKLLEALAGAADGVGGREADRFVDISEIAEFTRESVRRRADELSQAAQKGGKIAGPQVPELVADATAEDVRIGAVPVGTIEVWATPWARVDRIVAPDGSLVDQGDLRYTPFVATLPEGTYSVTLSYDGGIAPQAQVKQVKVERGRVAAVSHSFTVELGSSP